MHSKVIRTNTFGLIALGCVVEKTQTKAVSLKAFALWHLEGHWA
jgi:hypothetical protein